MTGVLCRRYLQYAKLIVMISSEEDFHVFYQFKNKQEKTINQLVFLIVFEMIPEILFYSRRNDLVHL